MTSVKKKKVVTGVTTSNSEAITLVTTYTLLGNYLKVTLNWKNAKKKEDPISV